MSRLLPHPTRLALLMLMLGSGCAAPFYIARSSSGRVIDADTKQPIPGAVVVAQWTLSEFARGESSVINAKEVTTNSQGEFTIPGWGPRLRPCLTKLGNWDPWLLIFKTGYVPAALFSDKRRSDWSIVRKSDFDGATIELKPFSGTEKQRRSQLARVVFRVSIAAFDQGYSFEELRSELLKEEGATLTGREWRRFRGTMDLMQPAEH